MNEDSFFTLRLVAALACVTIVATGLAANEPSLLRTLSGTALILAVSWLVAPRP